MDSPKKRGRPKKVESPKAVVNEEAKMITMTQDKPEEDVSLKAIQQILATIFGKYAQIIYCYLCKLSICKLQI